jgi:low temperature requirement protein LtrA
VAIPVHASHVPERLALFTIIVLGETIVVAALGTSDPEWALSAVVAVLGFLVASAVWWIYFGSGSEVALRPSPTSIVVFVYAHIPLLLALTAVSAGISLAIEQSSAAGLGAGVRRALAGGAAVYLAFVTAAQAARAQGVSAGVLRSRIGAAMALVVLALVGGAGPGRVHGRSGERSRRRCRRQALGGRTRTPVERGLNWTPCLDRRWAS